MKSKADSRNVSPEGKKFGGAVGKILRKHHKGTAGAGACAGCGSGCCSRGGFAILENVRLIYKRYNAGKLQRDDYQFTLGLSFKAFVEKYFDIELWRAGKPEDGGGLLLFRMKNLGPDGRETVAIPRLGPYSEVRNRLFDLNPWLNRGCVFLSQGLRDASLAGRTLPEDGRCERHCILHQAKSATQLSAKPIDCVLFTCGAKPLKAKPVDEELGGRWLAALAEAYPGSRERYEALCR